MPDRHNQVMREFSKEILSFQAACGLSDIEFSGMLLGVAATMTQRAGIPRFPALKIFNRCYSAAVNDPEFKAVNDK